MRHADAISETPNFYVIYMVEFEQGGRRHFEDRRDLSEFQNRCRELLSLQENGALKIVGTYRTLLDTREVNIKEEYEWTKLPF